MNFWANVLNVPPKSEAPQQPLSLGDEYRAWQRAKAGGNGSSGSAIYSLPLTSEQRAAQRLSIYEDRPYGGLQSYSGQQADPMAQKPGESLTAYERRLGSVARALPEGEAERRLAEARKRASEQSWSWEAHRAEVDNRIGTGTGVLGNMSPTERAATLGGRFGKQIDGQGSLANSVESLAANRPMSAAEVNAIMRARDAKQRGLIPQRTQAPTGSSGEGIFVR